MSNSPTMITSYVGGKAYCEYVHYIDLNPRPGSITLKIPGIKGIIYTHFPKSDVKDFFDGLTERKLLTAFGTQMKSVPSNPARAWITLTPRIGAPPFTVYECSQHTHQILNYLNIKGYPIIWKEDKHGYEITTSGYIKRKWELDPF